MGMEEETKPEFVKALEARAMSYSVRVTRIDFSGRRYHAEFGGYELLSELLEAIVAEVEGRGWLDETPAEGDAP